MSFFRNRDLRKYIKKNLVVDDIDCLVKKVDISSKRKRCFEEDLKKEEVVKEKSIGRVSGSSLNGGFLFDRFECESCDVDSFIKDNTDYNSFQKVLFNLIDDRNLKDSDVYNKVHLDRRLFSKIRNDKDYHPSKETVLLLGLSLELSEYEIEDLLMSASYSLPKNNHYDLIMRYCFMKGIYKINDVNDLLEQYDCKLFNC